jgi:hypothetical protein
MAIVQGLLVTAFLILFIASLAVVGSMLVLALSDFVSPRRRPSNAPTGTFDANSTLAQGPDLEEAMSNWRRERGSPPK